jgi:FkbM family methyltransferase
MELSYAQNLEDYHLSLAFAGQTTGSYIDVGAGHPVADNVSFWFYERGWRGVVIEPQPALAALYGKLRPRDALVAALVGRQEGEADFHVVDRLHGLSTVVRDLADKAATYGVGYRTCRMPVTTLARACEEHDLRSIDFLKIDVEGAETDVLRGGDWTRFRPKVIVCEATAPVSGEPVWHHWEPFLLDQGYRFVLFDNLNRFYVAEEHPDILARLPADPAPRHAVRRMNEVGRALENAQHPDHALAWEFTRGFLATLPYLDAELITLLLSRARAAEDSERIERIAANVSTETFRASLGRIACGYDGGQIIDQ